MASSSRQHVAEVLSAANAGDPAAAEQLLPLVYSELRELARQRMARESPGLTLQPTALVHEAYLRLLGERQMQWANRAHFFAAAAQAMRRILIERARRQRSRKKSSGELRGETPKGSLSLDEIDLGSEEQSTDLIALEEALRRLQARDGRKCDIVMLRFFAGLTIEQTAEALNLSLTTVKDEWSFARAWLHSEIRRRGGSAA